LAELTYWQNKAYTVGKGWDYWRYSIMSYNAGTNGYKNKSGLGYYKEIVKIIKALKIVKNKLKLK